MATSVKSKGGPAYKAEFETAHEAFRIGQPLYDKKCGYIDERKGKWERRLTELSSQNFKPIEKSQLLSEIGTHVQNYEGMIKAQQGCQGLLAQLTTAVQSCQKWARDIPSETLETLKGVSKLKPEDILSEQGTLKGNIATLEDSRARIQVIYDRMVDRLPKAAQELDALIKFVKAESAEWRLTGWMKYKAGYTPYLNAELAARQNPATV